MNSMDSPENSRCSTLVRASVTMAGLLCLVASVGCSVHPRPEEGAWPLEGQHADLSCETCHTAGFEAWLPNDCSSCHLDDRPAEHDMGDCGECHTANGWAYAYDHPHFPLQGGHAGLTCDACHANGYGGTPTTCEACHAGDEPNDHHHGNCGECHNIYDWEDADD